MSGRIAFTFTTVNTYVPFGISIFSNDDHDSYDTDGQKVMRMGFGGENLVANAGLGDGGGGGHGHGHSHNPYDTDNQEVGVIRRWGRVGVDILRRLMTAN